MRSSVLGFYIYLFFLLSLLFTAHLKGASEAQPISRSELADFKDLLERFENKLELAERGGREQDLDEPNEELVGDAAQPVSSWDGEYPRPQKEGGMSRVNWQSQERAPGAVQNKLGGFLNAPRRVSNCFGQRLDRIGSVSGLGCKRSHTLCENQIWRRGGEGRTVAAEEKPGGSDAGRVMPGRGKQPPAEDKGAGMNNTTPGPSRRRLAETTGKLRSYTGTRCGSP
ncbi:natriuretic peptides A [Candoia aspera]|uniref:natriuretic peptides A n=1 Tax=Candoia aspera TaxID=51853 RepID=UPI002FD8320B